MARYSSIGIAKRRRIIQVSLVLLIPNIYLLIRHQGSVPKRLAAALLTRIAAEADDADTFVVDNGLQQWGKPVDSHNVQRGLLESSSSKDDKVAPLLNQTGTSSFCPEVPAELVGQVKTNLNPINLSALESKHPEISKGGNYHPLDCQAKQKLAIIIPYRNRQEHLQILLNNLLPILVKQKLDFTIFVINQALPTTFNRGMLFNIGYLEALKRGDYDCFIFHDVDMIPTNDNCFYRCTENPRHFLTAVSKYKYGLPYKTYFGGVVAFTQESYKKINGDSNLYFGWGGEDDDLRARVVNKGYSQSRYPKEIGRYDTMSHSRDVGNEANKERNELLRTAKKRQDVEGLSTTKYEVDDVVEEKLYTMITANINMTEVFLTAPAYVKGVLKNNLNEAKKFDNAAVLASQKKEDKAVQSSGGKKPKQEDGAPKQDLQKVAVKAKLNNTQEILQPAQQKRL